MVYLPRAKGKQLFNTFNIKTLLKLTYDQKQQEPICSVESAGTSVEIGRYLESKGLIDVSY